MANRRRRSPPEAAEYQPAALSLPAPVAAVGDSCDPPQPKLKRRAFVRGQRPSRTERRYRTKQIAQLVGQGMEETAAVEELCDKWGVRDPVTRRRYRDAYFAYAARGSKITREAMTSTAIHQRMEVIRRAYLRTKLGWSPMVDAKGKPVIDSRTGLPKLARRVLSDPDFDAIMRALESISRIQGLSQPESLEAFDELLGPRVARIVDVLRRFISDPVGLGRIAREMRIAIKSAPATVVDSEPVKLIDEPTAEAGAAK